MARNLPLVALCLLIACKQELTFDERFAETQQRLEAKSAAIDQELTKAEQDARVAGAAQVEDSTKRQAIDSQATPPTR